MMPLVYGVGGGRLMGGKGRDPRFQRRTPGRVMGEGTDESRRRLDLVRVKRAAQIMLPNQRRELAGGGAKEEYRLMNGHNAVELAGPDGAFAARAQRHEMQVADGQGGGEAVARLRRQKG